MWAVGDWNPCEPLLQMHTQCLIRINHIFLIKRTCLILTLWQDPHKHLPQLSAASLQSFACLHLSVAPHPPLAILQKCLSSLQYPGWSITHWRESQLNTRIILNMIIKVSCNIQNNKIMQSYTLLYWSDLSLSMILEQTCQRSRDAYGRRKTHGRLFR